MDNKEQIEKYHELLRAADINDIDSDKKQQLLSEATELKEKIDSHLSDELDVVSKEIIQQVKPVVNMKQLKKDLNQKYKAVREEYAELLDKLKANVELKKEMRKVIADLDKVMKDDNLKYEEEKLVEIREKYLQ